MQRNFINITEHTRRAAEAHPDPDDTEAVRRCAQAQKLVQAAQGLAGKGASWVHVLLHVGSNRHARRMHAAMRRRRGHESTDRNNTARVKLLVSRGDGMTAAARERFVRDVVGG